MPCAYFRYINLLEVYEQLEGYTFYSGPDLSNIQYQFGESLSWCLEELSNAAFNECEEDAWKTFPAIEVATAVGSVIEASLERIAKVAEISIPSRRASARTAIFKLATLSIHASFGDFDYWQKISLMVYQYDLLCWLYSKNKIEEAFEVCELILKTRGDLQSDFTLSLTSAKQSEIASERAKKRHAPTNKVKTDLMSEWDKTSNEYKGRADFARIIGKRDGIKERTLYEWIAAHEKSKA